ncbi:MAG: M24 family metallopeptidase [Microbacterium sp.]|uniref:M24 family metallopeptidase n=1 Tax=Microbacterium sp. TaxID=51671 RepID=UPI0039E3C5FE
MHVRQVDFANRPVSDAELHRRTQAILHGMAREQLDALVVYGSTDDLGGYVRYLIDLPAGGYGTAVILTADGDVVVISHGAIDGDVELPAGHGGLMRGASRIVSFPYFPTASYTAQTPGRLAARALARLRRGRIGLAGRGWMPSAFEAALADELPGATLVDASEVIDRVKAIKSDEEIDLVVECAGIQDRAMAAAMAAIAPGVRQRDIAEVARRACIAEGAEAGIVLVGSGPAGTGWSLSPRHGQNRVVEDGDMVAILIEMDGPGGIFAELGRTAILGDVPDAVAREYRLADEAQRFTLDLLTPGASCSNVWAEYNAYLTGIGRPVEQRVHCHGQGVDLVERPIVRFDEPMEIEAGMNLTCHPTWVHDGIFSWTCDNYVISSRGAGQSVHRTPQGIHVLA